MRIELKRYKECTHCQGTGITKLLVPLSAGRTMTEYYPCDNCGGKGYFRDTLQENLEHKRAYARAYYWENRTWILRKQKKKRGVDKNA